MAAASPPNPEDFVEAGARVAPPAVTPEELLRVRRGLCRLLPAVAPPGAVPAALPGTVLLVTGSRLWGTRTAHSDVDCVVVLPPSATGGGGRGKVAPGVMQGGGPMATALPGGAADAVLVTREVFAERVLRLQEPAFVAYLCAPPDCVFDAAASPGDAAVCGDGATWLAAVRGAFVPSRTKLVAELADACARDCGRVRKLLARGGGAKAAKVLGHCARAAAVVSAIVTGAAAAMRGNAWRLGAAAVREPLPTRIVALQDALRSGAADADSAAALADECQAAVVALLPVDGQPL